MSIRDRIKQTATATSGTALSLTGAAASGRLTFEQGFQVPTAAQVPAAGSGGIVKYVGIPVLVERADGSWGIHRATLSRDGSDQYSLTLDALLQSSAFNTSTRAFGSYGLAASDVVTVSCVPSVVAFGQLNLQPQQPQTNYEHGEGFGIPGYTMGSRRSDAALLALGTLAAAGRFDNSAGSDGAIAIGNLASAGVNADAQQALAVGYSANVSKHYAAVFGGIKGYTNHYLETVIGAAGRGHDIDGSVSGYALPAHQVLMGTTTDATSFALRVYDYDDTEVTDSEKVYADAGLNRIRGTVFAYEPATEVHKAWDIDVLVRSLPDYSATATVGTPVYTEILEETGSSAWTVSVSTDNATNSFSLNVTGEAAKTIGWAFIGTVSRYEVY